jgi:hypothetical protein
MRVAKPINRRWWLHRAKQRRRTVVTMHAEPIRWVRRKPHNPVQVKS